MKRMRHLMIALALFIFALCHFFAAAAAPDGDLEAARIWLQGLRKHYSAERLRGLTSLSLKDINIKKSGLVHLQALPNLRSLDLSKTRIAADYPGSKEGRLEHIGRLDNLAELDLGQAQIHDADLASLAGLRNLRKLSLFKTKITDAGLDHLKELKGLRYLDLRRTSVTEKAVNALQEALPGCRIRTFHYMEFMISLYKHPDFFLWFAGILIALTSVYFFFEWLFTEGPWKDRRIRVAGIDISYMAYLPRIFWIVWGVLCAAAFIGVTMTQKRDDFFQVFGLLFAAAYIVVPLFIIYVIDRLKGFDDKGGMVATFPRGILGIITDGEPRKALLTKSVLFFWFIFMVAFTPHPPHVDTYASPFLCPEGAGSITVVWINTKDWLDLENTGTSVCAQLVNGIFPGGYPVKEIGLPLVIIALYFSLIAFMDLVYAGMRKITANWKYGGVRYLLTPVVFFLVVSGFVKSPVFAFIAKQINQWINS